MVRCDSTTDRSATSQRRHMVATEEATTVWLAMRLGPTSFAVVDAFLDDAGRQVHLAANADALTRAADELFTEVPSIERTDLIAAKLAGEPLS
jgi:hypothetical protein